MEFENKAYLKVIQYVKELILNKEISVGNKLPTERELSETLNLSRNSIREALKIMNNMGIVESKQGSGNYLSGNIERSFTDSLSMMILMKRIDYLEISQLRRGIEVQALSLAIISVTEEEITYLNNLLNRMDKCNEKEEATLDKEFHYFIVSISKNELMVNIMGALSEICKQFIEHLLNYTLKDKKDTLKNLHRKILQSLIEKDLTIGIGAINDHYNIIDEGLMKEKK